MNEKTAATLYKVLLEVGKTVLGILDSRSKERKDPNAHEKQK